MPRLHYPGATRFFLITAIVSRGVKRVDAKSGNVTLLERYSSSHRRIRAPLVRNLFIVASSAVLGIFIGPVT